MWVHEKEERKHVKKRTLCPLTETYGVESKLMLFACVDDADL